MDRSRLIAGATGFNPYRPVVIADTRDLPLRDDVLGEAGGSAREAPGDGVGDQPWGDPASVGSVRDGAGPRVDGPGCL